MSDAVLGRAQTRAGERLMRFWTWGLWLAPVSWLTGGNIFFFHLWAAGIFLYTAQMMNRDEIAVYLPPSGFVLMLFVAAYLFSMAVNGFGNPLGRMLASGYNLSFWLMGLLLAVGLANVRISEAVPALYRAVLYLCLVAAFALLAAAVLAAAGHVTWGYATPLLPVLGDLTDAALMRQSLEVLILFRDWFGDRMLPRFNFLSPYPNATAGVLILMLIALWHLGRMAKEKNPLLKWVLPALLTASFLWTFSRLGFLAFVLSTLMVSLARRKNTLVWILFLLLGFALAYPWLERFMDWLLQLRSSSTEVRFAIYENTIAELEGLNWFYGLGIKPRIFDFTLPLGSHSTYLSVLLKTGLLGLSVLMVLGAYLLFSWYGLQRAAEQKGPVHYELWKMFGKMMLFVMMWMLFEDLDAPQFMAFLSFSMVGFYESLRRELRYG